MGLIPSAGGIKESVLRTMDLAKGVTWPFPNLMPTFEALAQAKTSGSAWEAFDLNYLRPGDGVTMNRESVIYAAKQVALGMLEAGYQTAAAGQGQGHGPRRHRQLPQHPLQHGPEPVHLRARPLPGREDRLGAVAAATSTPTPRWTSGTCSTWSARPSWRSAARPRRWSGSRPCSPPANPFATSAAGCGTKEILR